MEVKGLIAYDGVPVRRALVLSWKRAESTDVGCLRCRQGVCNRKVADRKEETSNDANKRRHFVFEGGFIEGFQV